jgi:hypothetical protein
VTSYEGTVSRYLVPALGKVPVAKLSIEDVTAMMVDLEMNPRPNPRPKTGSKTGTKPNRIVSARTRQRAGLFRAWGSGSGERIRTSDQVINSHPLYH